VIAEVVEAAAADGRPLPAGTARAMLAATDAMAPYAPSMKVDYDERRPLELGAIYRAPLARAAAAGAAMPRTAALADALTFLDARNQA
jgi:2-dehydropantoate 2-reductase